MFGVDRQEWAALRALAGHVGWIRAVRLGLYIRRQTQQGHPFKSLPPAVDEREAESREQLAGAVLLYMRLRETDSRERALEVVAPVVEASAHVLLSENIGEIDWHALAEEEGRHRYIDERLRRFPNTVYQIEEMGARRVRFTVSHCHFATLCKALGVPELSPVFCAVDASYFGGVETRVSLHRPETLASGGSQCDFNFSIVEGDESR